MLSENPMSAPRIRVLSQTLIDQIAAGEVVERPASVVKELIENALDADAQKIEVTIERGGLGSIRVTDDGVGMTSEEAHLAVKRHATSKLTAFDELESIGTMGFRGEALPSIASVSRLSITTRTQDSDAAFTMRLAGGELDSSGPAGAPVGTTIEVRDLFYNVPARLKFMKAEATEMTHTVDAVVRLALCAPHVHLRLKSGTRVLLDLPAHSTAQERVKAALSRNARSTDRLIATAGGDQRVRIDAYLGPPDEAAHTTRSTFLYVNRRFVRDRALLSALSMGYGELLDKGRYPLAVVFLSIDGKDVDVNVHPQKSEVRFREPQAVQATLRYTVAQAVAQAAWQPGAESTPVRVYSLPPTAARDPSSGYEQHRKRGAEALKLFAPPPRPLDATAPGGTAAAPPAPLFVQALERGEGFADAKRAARADAASSSSLTISQPGFFSSLRYLGQLDRTYLLCEAASELVLIDQHSAHERVAFQRLREGYEHRRVRSQRLLLPATMACSPDAGERLVAAAATITALGFEIERSTPDRLLIRAVPDGLGDASPEALVGELIATLDDSSAQPLEARVEQMLAQLACHSVVRAGDVLTPSEVTALLASLDGVDHRAPAPHGRPVLLRISLAEIERRFGRT